MSKPLPTRLETARTYMRLPQASDAQELNAGIVESYPEIKQWVPWATQVPSLEDSQTYCAQSLAKHNAGEALNYLMFSRETDEFIAGIGIPRLDWSVPMFEIGYWCRTVHTGKGYISEGVLALSQFCFDSLSAARLELHIDELNGPSVKVAEACGYQLESVARRSARNNAGELCDIRVYRCLDPAELSTRSALPSSA